MISISPLQGSLPAWLLISNHTLEVVLSPHALVTQYVWDLIQCAQTILISLCGCKKKKTLSVHLVPTVQVCGFLDVKVEFWNDSVTTSRCTSP